LHEINRNPNNFIKIAKNSGLQLPEIFNSVSNEIKNGKIKPIPLSHLFINIISLCIFPMLAKPVLLKIFFNDSHNAFNEFIEQRKQIVFNTIWNDIKTE